MHICTVDVRILNVRKQNNAAYQTKGSFVRIQTHICTIKLNVMDRAFGLVWFRLIRLNGKMRVRIRSIAKTECNRT